MFTTKQELLTYLHLSMLIIQSPVVILTQLRQVRPHNQEGRDSAGVH